MSHSSNSRHSVRPLTALALLPLLLAAGCAVGPDFEQPKVTAPDQWQVAAPVPANAADIANLPWWEVFKDADLQTLVRDALTGNPDIRAALARLEAARAAAGISNAQYFPSLSYNASAFRYDKKNVTVVAGSDGRAANVVTSNAFALGGAVNWEFDLWGRVRRLNEAATARYFAEAENKNAVVLALVAGVAEAWFNLRSFDEKIRIAEETYASRKESARLARLKFDNGVASEIDPLQFEAEALQAQADLRSFKQAASALENAISILVGKTPGPITRKPVDKNAPPALADIPAGVPSDILLRRPDLRAAEHSLRAVNAQIGAAVASFFPRITLTGVLNFAAPQLKGLVDRDTKYTSGGGSILGPLFDAGATYYAVKEAKALTQAALAQYEKAALTAFAEVNDVLVAQQTARERVGDLSKIVEQRRKILDKVSQAEEGGVFSKFAVLDADRALYGAQLALVEARSADQLSVVRLYKALGGGWNVVVKSDKKDADKGDADKANYKPLVDNTGTIAEGPGKGAKNKSSLIAPADKEK
jgi:multidrug efflux system outer membrane protein